MILWGILFLLKWAENLLDIRYSGDVNHNHVDLYNTACSPEKVPESVINEMPEIRQICLSDGVVM